MIYIPARMGLLNKRALLARLRKAGRASRAELAKSLGMSQPTAGKIVDELLAEGVLEEVEASVLGGEGAVRLGRPGRLLQLHRTESRFLAIQLGVAETALAGLPLDAGSEDCWQARFSTPPNRGNPAENWQQQLKKVAGQFGQKKFWGVLVSVPGITNEAASKVLFSPNLHWTESVDLPALIKAVWDAPVLLVQEERALALGHHLANPQDDDFLLVDIGEGVGGAIILHGRPYANPLPINGELGHTPVLGNRRPCGCGAIGCVETLVSTNGLLKSFVASGAKGPHTWAALGRQIAERGVPRWMAETLDATANTIAGALNVLGLRRVVITGNLAELSPVVVEYLSRMIQKGALWARFGQIECESAPRRRAAGLVAVGIDQLVVPMAESHGQVPTDYPLSPISQNRNNSSRVLSPTKSKI